MCRASPCDRFPYNVTHTYMATASSLPQVLRDLIPPGALREECYEAWAELLADDHALTESLEAVNTEPQLADRHLEAALQQILLSLNEEEERWRSAASSLEQRWHAEANLLVQRWREEDATLLDRRKEHATGEVKRGEERLSALTPVSVHDWLALVQATSLDQVDVKRIVSVCSMELLATEYPDSLAASSAGTHNLASASWTSPSPSVFTRLPALFMKLREAGAGALDDEPLRSSLCMALQLGHHTDDDEPPPATPATPAAIAPLHVLMFLLMLVDGASTMQRLETVLEVLIPRALRSPLAGTPLTLSEQRLVYGQLAAAGRTAVSATMALATFPETVTVPRSPPPAPPDVKDAFERRPQSWNLCPPDARAFAIWCATVAAVDTVGAAIAGASNGLSVSQLAEADAEEPGNLMGHAELER